MEFQDLKEIRKSRPIIVAHRGAIGVNVPCNTLESFQVAINQGADVIELDVTKCLDGELFVFHPFMDFAHLGKILPMQFKFSSSIKKIKYRNIDFVKTEYGIPTLDEAFDFLKDKCVINVDKFSKHPDLIIEKIKKHNLKNKVIAKGYYNEKLLKKVSQKCPELPFMLMVRNKPTDIRKIKDIGVNLVAEELIFDNLNNELIQEDYISYLHRNGVYAWVNTILYNHKDVISGGLTDDRAVINDPKQVWGYFRDKQVDFLQTDWVRELSLYLEKE